MEVDVNNAVNTYAMKQALQLQKDHAEDITKMMQQSNDVKKSADNQVKIKDNAKGNHVDLQA